MIISRTPFRVSLFGGGTDYPPWYLKHGGAVLGAAIDKYCYISIRHLPPFFEHKHRVIYSRVENVLKIEEIQHPAVRAVLSEMQVEDGVEIHHDADLPARSGLGSSSSFTVGLLNSVKALRSEMASAQFLAKEAIRIEQEVIRENVGSQDQIWAAYGGLNLIEFHTTGEFTVSPVILPPGRRELLNDHLMMFFTGFSRFATEIAGKKIANLAQREQQLRTMRAMVDEALEMLVDEREPITRVGELLHESWMLKKELADSVSNSSIDEIYDAGMAGGAAGGKLLGAGAGGFVVFIVDPSRQEEVRERLRHLIEVQVNLGAPGSRIVVYEPEGLERV